MSNDQSHGLIPTDISLLPRLKSYRPRICEICTLSVLRSPRLALILVAWLVSIPVVPTLAQSEPTIIAFVDRVIAASSAIVATASRSEEAARQECDKLMGWAFDVPGMAQFVLGGGWKKATANERNTFRAGFEKLIVNTIVHRLRSDPGITFAFIGVRPEANDHMLAAVRVMAPDRPEQIWLWRLRPAPSSTWRVVDFIVDGRSILLSERQEYALILESNNGNIGAVIEFIKKRTQR